MQTWLVKKVTGGLSEKLHADISIRHVDFEFFDKLELKGLYVQDQHKDTLLYAGSATIKVTDWFFLKEKVTIHYAALEDAQVNLYRSKDTVWNHQFLIDYFSGPKKTKDSSAGIELLLQELHLKNVAVKQIDGWKGKDMLANIGMLDLVTDTFDLKKQIISISKLSVDQPRYIQRDYTGERDRLGIVPPVTPKDSTKPKDGLVIWVKQLHITNGTFGSEAESTHAAYTDRFDGNYIRFENINADMKNLRLANDTLTTHITLATKERSGFEVRRLDADMKFTPEIMEFNNLDLATNKSRLGSYYSMRYNDFDEDMGHFLHNIQLNANFVNSELYSDDLAFFAPELKTWKRVFHFSGKAKGTIDNLSATKMLIKTGNSMVDGDIALKGLPEIESTFIDFTSRQLQTNYDELAALIPALKEVSHPKLNRLGNIGYRGNFTGFINDFVAFGTINTNLGTATGDLNMKLPANKPAVYSGSLATQGFRLGEFLDDRKVGAITFNGKVNGSGFSFNKNLDAKFDGQIRSVQYDGYNYQNITLKGGFKNKLFNGFASANDPNLKVESLTGSIDFNGDLPVFNFDAKLNRADFKSLGLTKDDYALDGHFIFNFTGDNIDNFLGSAKIKDAHLLHDNLPLSFDSLLLESQYADGKKYLSLHSNELDASVSGTFNIKELPGAFTLFLNRYYPAYIKTPGRNISNQDFNFEIKTKNIDGYIQLMDKKLRGFNNSTISGNLKLARNELNITAEVPQFMYDGKAFNNVILNGSGNRDSLATQINVEDIALSDSLHLPFTNLMFTSSNNVSDVSIKTSASKTLSEASVNARVTTLSDAVKIHFFPSSFIINDKKWQLEKDGEITIGKSLIDANDVKFVQGEQQIKISTEPASIGQSNDVVIELSKMHMDDLAALGVKNLDLQGETSGTIKIEDAFGKPFVAYDLAAEKFMLGKDSFGIVTVKGNYDIQKGVLTPFVTSSNPNNQLDISGTINLKDSNGVKTSLLIKSQKLQLSFLNAFLGDLFTDIQGTANTSDLSVNSDGNNTVLSGTANIDEGSLIVNYTQCKYKFRDESIVFNPNEIDFGNITLKDTLNNTATLSGKLYHHFFKEMEFDNISLTSPRLLVLNTTKKDNPVFYGKVIGKIDKFIISGNEDDILMDIKGEPTLQDSSHVYIVSGNSIEKEDIDYIDFIKFGTEMDKNFKSKAAANVLVAMELKANPSCKVDVILDEATGDVIKGEGTGILKIKVGNKEDMTINGRYDITRGEYTFNFQTFLKKYFTVNSGSSIVWDGDPFKANIDITAEYTATNVDFRALSSGSIGGTGSFNQKSDVRILAHLTKTLLQPDIDFELQLPAGSPISDFLVLKRLEQFKQDKNELNKQITSLLLFNSFIGYDQSFITASGGFSVLSNTIGGVVSGAITGFFNELLQRYVKNLTFNFDVNSSVDLQQNVEKLQTAARSNFVYTLLNGRLIISAGLNLDYNNPYANINRNSNLLITPDVTVEWILNKTGRLRIVGFNRTNYDLVGQRNRTGVSLSYRRDFNRLAKVFRFLFLDFGGRNKKATPEKTK